MDNINYGSEIIALEDEIESIEIQIKTLELDLIKKKKHLKKRIDGKFASIFIDGIIELENKYSTDKNAKIFSLLDAIFTKGECDYIKISKDNYYIYVNLNAMWEDMNIGGLYSKKEFTKDLKNAKIVTGESKDYYKSVRMNGKPQKGIRMNYQIIREILKEA